MRIAMICNTCPEAVDEDSLFPATWDLACRLVTEGHEVLVVSPASNYQGKIGAYTLSGVRVFRTSLPSPCKRVFNSHPSLENLGYLMSRSRNLYIESEQVLREFQPDVLETQEFFGLGLSLLSNKLCPTVVRCHGAASFMFKEGFYKGNSQAEIALLEGLECSSVLLADALISVCEDVAQRLSDSSGRNIVDFNIVRNPLALPSACKESYELNSGGPQLIFWGQVARLKGADLLIDALPIVAKEFPQVHLSIFGAYAHEVNAKSPYSDVLKQKLRSYELLDHVTFYGHQSRKRIFDLALRSDLGIFPSRYETACYSNLEAMSLGLPVVASRVGGLKEYCLDGESGLLFESASHLDLAAKILQILSDSELRSRLGKAGRLRVGEFCDPALNLRKSIEIYENAIAAKVSADSLAYKASSLLIEKLYEAAGAPAVENKVTELSESIHPVTTQRGNRELFESATPLAAEQAPTHDLSERFASAPTKALARELARRIRRKLISFS